MESKAGAHLIISGRVQGVCFRLETQRAAMRLGVAGWVRNRRDGTVEASVEGNRQDVIALIEWCKQGPPVSKVKNVAVTWKAYEGDEDTFSIRS
jgi:acylphosphatase